MPAVRGFDRMATRTFVRRCIDETDETVEAETPSMRRGLLEPRCGQYFGVVADVGVDEAVHHPCSARFDHPVLALGPSCPR